MARRVVMGNIGGVYDLRISRPGYDAMTADVNNVRQISFSAQRSATSRVASAGEISSLDTWKSFGHTFDDPPPVLALLKRGSYVITDLYQEYPRPNGYQRGSGFTVVVQSNRLLATRPSAYGLTLGNDKFIFYTLASE
ncbi:hypothetical protein [Microvirga lenta]|uniref:hypothetical protein n=1 Tax=Microvirga lenta TaxID=2881337 RepID=UPI001CFCB322|nr:hypothetical protein [Microvirga lenta]MCB5173637.1 hypothetical protein [Microvirga lenta]